MGKVSLLRVCFIIYGHFKERECGGQKTKGKKFGG